MEGEFPTKNNELNSIENNNNNNNNSSFIKDKSKINPSDSSRLLESLE
jgi:hypothetical protein